ncbi:MAG: HAD-IIA family hydrolase [Chloroflexota bacterium]
MHSANDSLNLNEIRAAIFDMDGVIWRGTEILPGVPDLFLLLQKHKIPYAMATNNSSRNVAEYVTRFEGLGIPITDQLVINSGAVTAEIMLTKYPAGTPIYVIGSDSLVQLLTSSGYVIDPEQASVVVVGLDVSVTYDKLRIAGQRILAGADFIGTNGDVSIPTPQGTAPGAGSILAALVAMTGKQPRLMGKPEPIMFEVVLERLGTPPPQTLMIGDRLDTDIDGARLAGLRTALILTGVSTRADIGAIAPDGIYDDLAALLVEWQQVLASE